MALLRRRETLVVAAVLLVCALALIIWWPGDDDAPARERHYQATTACLLTDDQGLAGAPAQAAWSAMREVSDRELIKVQYLSISGPQTAANGLGFFNSLGTQRCGTIIAVGAAPIAALNEGRAQFPDITYITVDKAAASDIREQVKDGLAG
ncbi:hypothetical protein AB0M54_06940 [Actinoplanes sp. NPDC051470]|uniref:hypothetical protein n=1 Tax=unclassified Actinoplanes TaxID=2626549 RepID=UPI00342CC1B1